MRDLVRVINIFKKSRYRKSGKKDTAERAYGPPQGLLRTAIYVRFAHLVVSIGSPMTQSRSVPRATLPANAIYDTLPLSELCLAARGHDGT